jgi:hypothetical protein
MRGGQAVHGAPATSIHARQPQSPCEAPCAGGLLPGAVARARARPQPGARAASQIAAPHACVTHARAFNCPSIQDLDQAAPHHNVLGPDVGHGHGRAPISEVQRHEAVKQAQRGPAVVCGRVGAARKPAVSDRGKARRPRPSDCRRAHNYMAAHRRRAATRGPLPPLPLSPRPSASEIESGRLKPIAGPRGGGDLLPQRPCCEAWSVLVSWLGFFCKWSKKTGAARSSRSRHAPPLQHRRRALRPPGRGSPAARPHPTGWERPRPRPRGRAGRCVRAPGAPGPPVGPAARAELGGGGMAGGDRRRG